MTTDVVYAQNNPNVYVSRNFFADPNNYSARQWERIADKAKTFALFFFASAFLFTAAIYVIYNKPEMMVSWDQRVFAGALWGAGGLSWAAMGICEYKAHQRRVVRYEEQQREMQTQVTNHTA